MSTRLHSFFLRAAGRPAMALMFLIFGQIAVAQCPFTSEFELHSTAIPGSQYFTGYIIHYPSNYNAAGNTSTYPLIITFPGNGGAGTGSASDLCNLLNDQHPDLPNLVNQGQFPANGVMVNGVTQEFIIVAVQYSMYDYFGGHYPGANDVEALLNYLMPLYRVDPTRIYLTGISSGANIALQYAASSVAHAQRLAAVSVLSGCTPTDQPPNQPGDPSHIAAANLPVWFIHCPDDGNPSSNPDYCGISTPTAWVNAINSSTPAPTAQASLTTLRHFDNSNPVPLDMCQGFAHNTWTSAYNQAFKPAELGNKNVFEWMLSNTRPLSALPVALKSFTARLQNNKVYLRWTVTTENKNAFFTLERAGTDQQFVSIGTVTGRGTSVLENEYEYTDNSPLSNLNYYRLVQTDENNKKTYYDVRKIMNRAGLTKLLTANPNPFHNELSAFIHVDRPQKVTVWITDMNGKKLVSTQSLLSEGTTTLNLNIAALPSGVYFLKANGDGVTEITKIIKQ